MSHYTSKNKKNFMMFPRLNMKFFLSYDSFLYVEHVGLHVYPVQSQDRSDEND
jgi:hypothetical protein